MGYQDHNCKTCGTMYHYQVPRGFFLKNVLGFLPIRIYWCPKCTTDRYVWEDVKSKKHYRPENSATKAFVSEHN